MKKIVLIICCALYFLPAKSQTMDLTTYVNPFIGTSGGSNTNPGVYLPWGLMSISPVNTYDGEGDWKPLSSPYYFGRKFVSGFSHINFSGTGCPDIGTFCLMPTTGDFSPRRIDFSEYSNEKASPGYYAVQLDKYNIKVELTSATRTAISKYTFPEGKSNIILNLGIGLTTQKGGFIRRISDTEVEGFKMIGGFCGQGPLDIVYFYAQISKMPVDCGIWLNGRKSETYRREATGNDVGAYFTFNTRKDEVIYVKLGASYVSIENARLNAYSEIPQFDFEKTRANAQQAWNKELSKIIVEGGTNDDKVKFYTAIYHALLHPNIHNDVNGDFQKLDSAEKGKAKDYNRYTLFSLWDTYRNVHPLLSLVYPKQQSDMVKTLIAMSDENGFLPRWVLGSTETSVMVGDPALPVIVDSWFRGIKDFDIDKAYKAMRRNAVTPEKDNYMRPGMEAWLKFGYIPEDVQKMGLRRVWGSVSTGLEYCIADWNLAQLAKSLGKEDDYNLFYKRSMSYKNYYDPSTGLMRPRMMDGQWMTPFVIDSKKYQPGFTEGNTWNYTFMVPHDIPGLKKLMGAKDFLSKLNTCFEKEYFDMTNEPNIAYPFLYNYIKGQEWRTQKQVRDVMNAHFRNNVRGIPGNDDCGTMSTWLVYAMMGFYPDCTGNMNYQLTSPVFDKITIHLDPAYYSGGTFVIEAENAGKDNVYIKKMELNGKKHSSYSINHQDIVKGGKLKFNLSSKN